MSDPREGARNWRLYVQYMIECGEKALSYVQGLDHATFIADHRTYDATLRNIELIGEHATHVPEDIREAHPEIEWRRMIGTRQHMAHSISIDNDVVWDIVQTDIPDLLPKLQHLLDSVG